MDYRGQIEQDRYFVEFVIRERRDGRFLDVGANDGQTMSNTLALERYLGWSGVCVEADSEMAERCRANRPGSRVVTAAAWSGRETLTLSRPGSGDRLLTRIAGLPGNADYFVADFETTLDQVVEAAPLADLLLEDETWFDYFTLDVEGAELQALRGIDWDRTQFGFLNIEHGHRPGMVDTLTQFMRERGYQLHRINFHDVEFTRPGFPVPPPARSWEAAATGPAGRPG
jgi:FkbM family methyltransferase